MTEPPSSLRQRAQARLAGEAEPELEGRPTAAALRRVVNELRVHQIELELQNEELRDAQRELEESCASLEASKHLYRELFEEAPIGFLRLDPEGAIVEANQAASELLGAPAGELAGRKLPELVAPESQDAYYLHRRGVLDDGRAIPIAVALRGLDGLTREVEIRMRPSDGDPHEIRVALLDTTALERAETGRQESERQRRLMGDALPVAVGYVGADGCYRFCNRAFEALCGWPAAVVHGRPIFEVLDPDTYAALREHVRAALVGESVRFEGQLAFPGTGPRFVSILFAPDRRPDARTRGFYMMIDDRTALEEARRALRKAATQGALAEERDRRALAADLHDDAGQLLSLASIKLRALQEEAGEAPWVARLGEVEELTREARRSITSLSFQLSPPLLYDVGFVAAAEWLAESLKQRYGLETQIVTADGEPPLEEATRATLFRALRELLINVARHAGRPRAEVVIQAGPERLVVTVADEGVGFDLRSRARGFGLWHVIERIESLGGSVAVASAPGEGTRVCVTVPTAREASS
jgi:PAS domain S-box-containing protein